MAAVRNLRGAGGLRREFFDQLAQAFGDCSAGAAFALSIADQFSVAVVWHPGTWAVVQRAPTGLTSRRAAEGARLRPTPFRPLLDRTLHLRPLCGARLRQERRKLFAGGFPEPGGAPYRGVDDPALPSARRVSRTQLFLDNLFGVGEGHAVRAAPGRSNGPMVHHCNSVFDGDFD